MFHSFMQWFWFVTHLEIIVFLHREAIHEYRQCGLLHLGIIVFLHLTTTTRTGNKSLLHLGTIVFLHLPNSPLVADGPFVTLGNYSVSTSVFPQPPAVTCFTLPFFFFFSSSLMSFRPSFSKFFAAFKSL